jgi:hypothetical protein
LDNEQFNHQDYIDKAKKAINFFISCQQWSGIKKTTVDRWLNNFPETKMEKYYALRLLSQILYYSEFDIHHMLKEGIFDKILGKELLLKKQVPAGFRLNQQELQYEEHEMLKKTLFVPLLDAEQPYESGNQIARILTQRLRIPTTQVTFASQIDSRYNDFDRLIIVDDCIGSGDQCRDFWNDAITSDGKVLRQWCADNNIKAHYVVIVGYEDNIQKLAIDLPDLDICCIELLQDEHKVFNEKSIFWFNEEEMRKAREFFERVTSEAGIPLLGYRDMDFAVIMHLNIPDWSLPLLWRKSPDWEIIMERKNSHG